MLENYKDKVVKVLVSADSGISTSTSVAGNSTISSIIQVFGKLIGYDKEYLEIEVASILYFNNTHTATNNVDSEQAATMLINRNKVIGIIQK